MSGLRCATGNQALKWVPDVMRHILLSVFLVGMVSLGAPVPVVETVKPVKATVYRWVSFPSTLVANRQVQLGARVSGHVKEVMADRGDVVKKGQLLAKVEVPELEVDLVKMQSEMDSAGVEYRRLKEAREKSPDLVLPQSVDDAEVKFSAARAGVERCRTLLGFAEIRAPFDGVVTDRLADEGAFVAPGGAVLFRLSDVGVLRCRVPVTELEVPFIEAGKPVRILPDAFPGKLFDAVVSRHSGVLDVATRTIQVEADVVVAGTGLRAGMSVTAKVGVECHEGVLALPVGALVMEKSSAFIFKWADGLVRKMPVKLGFNDGVLVEVLGVDALEEFVVPKGVALLDGQAVQRVSEPSGQPSGK
jgi:RND family efflux transporter MFP subunit